MPMGKYPFLQPFGDSDVWHDFDNIEVAKAFANSRELRAAMKGAGVVGTPTIWFTRHT
jgi:hypothetical protein